ncbi:FAD/NAD(P)-binding domain-containing protein [Trametopsis cervina]|nr:FAD/NAD(P)-binding domain-containing protein [Trametopsis cervina]
MVYIPHFVISLLSASPISWLEGALLPLINSGAVPSPPLPGQVHVQVNVTKSIAIVGSGSGGLAILKTLLDLPEDVRSTWRIVLFEQRRDVGGVWLPDLNTPHPPTLPETPLYPRLRTNTPHPTMTYPGSPFPPNTPLFPSWEFVHQYHVDYAKTFDLYPYIRLNHTVVAAGWHGNRVSGKWEVEVARTDKPSHETEHDFFDHLIVANGHNHYPRVPHWDGEEGWLANTPPGTPKREIHHSIFYRKPEYYVNRTVVVAGAGASGRDAVLQVGPLATVYHSLQEGSTPPDGAKATPKPPISHFTNDSVVFVDGSSLSSVDSILLATGYQFLVPFLSRIPSKSGLRAPTLIVDPHTQLNSTSAQTLTTNSRYIFPIYEDVFSLSAQYPSTALAFVGLPVIIANCPSDRAQALFISHAIADPSILPSRTEGLDALVRREENRRQRGFDPYYTGHKMVGGDTEGQDYQDALVQRLKERGKLPNDGKKYVEDWRRSTRRDSGTLSRAWSRVEKLGTQAEWLKGVETEEQWADLMERLRLWQAEWEAQHGESVDAYSSVTDWSDFTW